MHTHTHTHTHVRMSSLFVYMMMYRQKNMHAYVQITCILMDGIYDCACIRTLFGTHHTSHATK